MSSNIQTRSFRDDLQKKLIDSPNVEKKPFREVLHKKLTDSPTLKSLFTNSVKLDYKQFIAKVIGTVMSNPALQKCSANSILQCCSKSAQLGLPVDASGYAYIVPKNVKSGNNWIPEATYQIGYRGYLELAKRNKGVKSIDSFLVYTEEVKNENFLEIRGSESKLTYKPDYSISREDSNAALTVALISYTNGGQEWEVMTKNEIEKAKYVSVKKDNNGKDKFSPWTDWWGEMAKKTVLRRLLKRCCLMNIDTAIELDEDEQWKDASKEIKTQPKSINDLMDDIDTGGDSEDKVQDTNTQSQDDNNNQEEFNLKL